MRRLYITLVSHCEKVWWDPGYDSLRIAVRAMLDLQRRVADGIRRPVTSTFCSFVDHPTSTTFVADAAQAPDVLREVLSSGNEVGLHVHAPTQELHTELQDRLISPDAELLTKLGLPQPKTYTPGDFVTSPQIVRYLEAAGFVVDCSVYTLQGSMDRFGVLVDYTKRQDLRPYHPDRNDLCAEGDSFIIEIPVSGHLTEFGGPEYDGLPPIEDRIRARYEKLGEGVDVFQLFWHPFEIVSRGKQDAPVPACSTKAADGRENIVVDHHILGALERFLLSSAAENEDVEIASAISAAQCWEAYHRSPRPRH